MATSSFSTRCVCHHLLWLSVVGALAMAACPVAIPSNESIGFACYDDEECPHGQRCVGQICLAPGALVDASAAEGPGHDALARDAIAGDGARRDRIGADLVRVDAAVADLYRADRVVVDTVAADNAAPDNAAPDSWRPDLVVADRFAPDAARPSVLLAHQEGSATIADTQTVVTVTLAAAVDPTRSILVFNTTTNSDAPTDGHVGGQLISNGSAVRFQRGTAATGVTADIAWTVVELDGISVQRGTEDAPAGTLVTDGHLGRAVDLARSFPLYSFHLGGGNYNDNDWREASFVDNQTLRFDRVASNDPGAIDWQVVEFLATSSGHVRTGNATMNAGSDFVTQTSLTPATDPIHAFLIFSYQLSGSAYLPSELVSGRIDNTSQLRFERAATDISVYITWYLVEWDAMRAQQGSVAFDNSQQDRSATLNPLVDLDRSVAFCPSYQRQGMTDYTADDVIGAGWFTTRITSSSNLAVHRAGAYGNARVDWSVVEFQ